LLTGFLLEWRDGVARITIEKAVLEIFGLLEAFVLRRCVDELTQNAAEAPHVDLRVVYGLGQYNFW